MPTDGCAAHAQCMQLLLLLPPPVPLPVSSALSQSLLSSPPGSLPGATVRPPPPLLMPMVARPLSWLLRPTLPALIPVALPQPQVPKTAVMLTPHSLPFFYFFYFFFKLKGLTLMNYTNTSGFD
jgi:hypothetical protein